MIMKHIQLCVLLLSAGLFLASCEKDVFSETDDEETEISGQSPKAPAQLNIVTRGSGDSPNENAVADGRVYVFDEVGQCVDLLTTTATSNQVMTTLPAGTYTFYAVGSSDLSRFALPTKEQASPSSVITLAENQNMCDLLQKLLTIMLEEGENITQNIVLDHKVLCIDQLEIQGVPDDVTKVEVSISPLYKSIQLDGSYVTNATESYKIALEQDGTSNTWQATPNQVLFPSKGTPNIKVSFTTASGVKSYSYTASEELPANHHFTISGTFTGNNDIALTGILTSSDWGEDRTITFGFDESNNVVPVAGKKFNSYYVISVNSTARTALLLAASSVPYSAPAANSSEATWRSALNTAMAALAKPENAQGEWRLPTVSEAEVFTTVRSLYTDDVSPWYFCLNNNALCWGQGRKLKTGTPEFQWGTIYNDNVSLRPVITVSY